MFELLRVLFVVLALPTDDPQAEAGPEIDPLG